MWRAPRPPEEFPSAWGILLKCEARAPHLPGPNRRRAPENTWKLLEFLRIEGLASRWHRIVPMSVLRLGRFPGFLLVSGLLIAGTVFLGMEIPSGTWIWERMTGWVLATAGVLLLLRGWPGRNP